MNERIKQLAEQATAKISFRFDPNTYKHIDDPEGDLERFEFDKQKFAQLILIEVTDILSTYRGKVVFQDGAEYNYEHPIIAIRKHFGVES